MGKKPEIRLVLKMCGGTLQDVFVNRDDVEITDIVLTEDAGYVEDRSKEFFVSGGRCDGDFVYTQTGDPIVDKGTVEAVIRSAEARSEAEELDGSAEGE